MIKRIVQFFKGVLAKGPNKEEQNTINDLLSPEAQQAFYHMTVADQRHTLSVMKTAVDIAEKQGLADSIDMDFLKRCCLLHDIGRGPRMNSIRKTYGVLLDKFFHEWSVNNSQCSSDSYFKEIMYRYYNHPEIGCGELMKMGMIHEADIVLRHHNGKNEELLANEQAVLKVLMEADSLN